MKMNLSPFVWYFFYCNPSFCLKNVHSDHGIFQKEIWIYVYAFAGLQEETDFIAFLRFSPGNTIDENR